jgi:hypothetical protein
MTATNERGAAHERDGTTIHIGLNDGVRVSFRDKGKHHPAVWAGFFLHAVALVKRTNV